MGNSPAAETSDRQWREALDGNLTSAFASVRACLPSLIARRGNVLFVASIASLAAGPQACGYVTAKHALIGLMRSVARDYGPGEYALTPSVPAGSRRRWRMKRCTR